MKINCIVRSSIEFVNSIDRVVVAHEVDPNERVRDLIDRLIGWDGSYSASIELRLAKPGQDEEKP